MKTLKINNYSEIPKDFTGIVIFAHKIKYWYVGGYLHRVDGPAKEWYHGHKEWYLKHEYYPQIFLEDYVVLDYYKGKY